ncbi:hypothetical protein [Sediminicoccus sp. KRV36]|uniref:hypothetical protein n=1 Tax=Sediminicoccus sp. KRV36 TaxID=3133721 RepID=UPI00200D66B2|nr:hypothetical protein [Sediminicoccus rosea]UPY37602.1 hypothetical protein LHU95_02610 [Sediminicoccus rosea]
MWRMMLLGVVIAPLLAPVQAAAQGSGQSRAPASPTPAAPAVTGEPNCDEQVRAWRACIAASNKSTPEKNTAYAEVNRFINDVRNATGANRTGLARACVPTSAGYRRMLAEGACARGQTGLYDDLRQSSTPAPALRR